MTSSNLMGLRFFLKSLTLNANPKKNNRKSIYWKNCSLVELALSHPFSYHSPFDGKPFRACNDTNSMLWCAGRRLTASAWFFGTTDVLFTFRKSTMENLPITCHSPNTDHNFKILFISLNCAIHYASL